MVITYSICASVEHAEKQICDVDKEIQDVEMKVVENVEIEEKWLMFMKKEAQLREDKKQLRKEKEQLLELLLVEKKNDLRPELPTGTYCI